MSWKNLASVLLIFKHVAILSFIFITLICSSKFWIVKPISLFLVLFSSCWKNSPCQNQASYFFVSHELTSATPMMKFNRAAIKTKMLCQEMRFGHKSAGSVYHVRPWGACFVAVCQIEGGTNTQKQHAATCLVRHAEDLGPKMLLVIIWSWPCIPPCTRVVDPGRGVFCCRRAPDRSQRYIYDLCRERLLWVSFLLRAGGKFRSRPLFSSAEHGQ